MKHIKLYEYFTDQPHIKDYVICDSKAISQYVESQYEKELDKFINNNPGQLVDKKREYNYNEEKYNILYIVKYKNIPDSIQELFDDNYDTNDYNNVIEYKLEDILFWAKTKPELKAKMTANKYNL